MAFQLLRCSVALAGDQEQVVVRHRGNPIVFPELIMLQYLHGEDAITDIHVVGEWDAPQTEVRTRLRTIYGDKAFGEVFAGAQPKIPEGDRSIPRCTLPIHVPGPTRPDSPDPIVKPLDQYTMPADMPRVVSTYQDDPAAPYADLDEIAGHAADELDDLAGLGLSDVLTTVNEPKPQLPDAASFRARDNSQGEGTAAPRTADHLPDVAGGALRDNVERSNRERALRGKPHG
jgi:hypothetical protein